MQTLLMVLLLVVTVAVACFDARDLFTVWYSVTSPSVSSRELLLVRFELMLCILLACVVGARLYFSR